MKSMYSRKIACICKNEYKYFLKKDNVVGVGRGLKVKNGIVTCDECIKVFVVKKLSMNKISSNNQIPKLYKGIPTDVEESGYIKFQSLREKVRPIVGGYSIGSYIVKDNNLCGCEVNVINDDVKDIASIGCLVTDGKYEYILSSNHGLVSKKPHQDVKIIQPSIKDGGKYPQDVVAMIWKFIPVKEKDPLGKNKNLVDASISVVSDRSLVSPIIYGIGIPIGITEGKINQTVMKSGRSSGLTYGKINAIDVTYEVGEGIKRYVYTDQIMTSKMSESGDSGCVLADEFRHVVGLSVASGTSCSSFCKIQNVLRLLNVTIVDH